MTDKQLEVRSDIDKICSAVMADTEALEDAKMTLEVIMKTDPGVYDEMINDTLSLIRKALSSSILGVIEKLPHLEANQNPYGYVWFTHFMEMRFTRTMPNEKEMLGKVTPVYTAPAPPQREWQGLTDEEIREFEIWLDDEEEKRGWNPPADIVKYIEAKLREKNT